MSSLINEIIEKEWEMFRVLKNIGGPAECQNNKEEFFIMRRGQWENLPEKILNSYLDDLNNAILNNRNLLQEKYVKMMEYSDPIEYENVKHILFELTPGHKTMIKQIENIYLIWGYEFEKKYPKFSKLTRNLKSENDTPEKASLQTYLRGELSSYSPKTVLFYLDYIKECYEKGINLIYETHNEVVKLKGFENLESVERNLNI